ncbi:PcfB family protein [Faecalibacterium taiwanense]|uniref:PcfB family protein n=1 Tax=Faecalibacterium taiwanense TaxID=3030638 RepID=UPI003312FB7A
MQEEIEQKSFNIMISTTKLSARTVLRAVKAAFRLYQSKASQGKQSVRTLLRQNRGVSSVEISKTGIRGLERYAKKYGIDYAIRKDTSEVPPRYLVFFKAPDAEAFQSAFKEYSASLLNKDKRPSVLARLQELVQAAAELPVKSGTRNRSVDYDHEKADKVAGAVSALSSAGAGGNQLWRSVAACRGQGAGR